MEASVGLRGRSDHPIKQSPGIDGRTETVGSDCHCWRSPIASQGPPQARQCQPVIREGSPTSVMRLGEEVIGKHEEGVEGGRMLLD